MSKSYIFKHWVATILIAALSLIIYGGFENHAIFDELWLFPYFLIGGALLSMPTLFFNILVLYALDRYKVNIKWVKPILISLTVIGVCVTSYLLSKTMRLELVMSYCIIAVICGLLFKVANK